MEGFSKQYLRSKQQRAKIQDTYDADIENMTKKTLAIQSRSFVEFAGKKQAMHFIKRSYIIVALGFLTSAIAYPISVRLVKKVFGFKDFFNIHFAIIPIMLNFNAVVLGATQGFINFHEVRTNYKLTAPQPQYL